MSERGLDRMHVWYRYLCIGSGLVSIGWIYVFRKEKPIRKNEERVPNFEERVPYCIRKNNSKKWAQWNIFDFNIRVFYHCHYSKSHAAKVPCNNRGSSCLRRIGRAKCGDVQTPIASRTHQAKITFAPNSDHFVFWGEGVPKKRKFYNFCGAMVKIMR